MGIWVDTRSRGGPLVCNMHAIIKKEKIELTSHNKYMMKKHNKFALLAHSTHTFMVPKD